MTHYDIIDFVENFESHDDGFKTADDVASGFFNSPAQICKGGDIHLENSDFWVSDSRIADFVQWLKDNNHV